MKTKYAAHLIMAIKVRDGSQAEIPFYENVLLIAADTADDAMRMACALGKRDEADLADDGQRWAGKPARTEFVGVRKLIECATPSGGGAGRLGHGSEVTYSLMAVKTEADLRKLAAGQSVDVTYRE